MAAALWPGGLYFVKSKLDEPTLVKFRLDKAGMFMIIDEPVKNEKRTRWEKMEFIGRKKELTALEHAYQAQGSAFMPVYGRRRVGKSELIKHFIKDKQALYFLGKQAPPRLQLKEFLRNGASALNQPLLEQARADDWQEAISLILKQAIWQ